MLSVLPDAVVTTTAIPVTIDVLANDSGAGLTITSFSNPGHGSLVFNADKTFTYTSVAGFVGEDSFSYTVRNAQGTPASTEVVITVTAASGTVATNDVTEVMAGGSVAVPVLANDLAAAGGTLQIITVGTPGHGVVSIQADQTILYAPQSGFTGIDSFTYTVTDGLGGNATATVTVKVLSANRPPIARPDSFTIVAGQPTLLAVLENDSDPENGPLQVVGFTMPNHGSLVFNADKTFTYTPGTGFIGIDSFTYTIRDNRGASASAEVSLEVIEIREQPTATSDHVTTAAGVPVTIDVLANDFLPQGQAIAIIAVTLPYKGSLVFNADKTITYTPHAGFVGTDDFGYTIGNGKGDTSQARVIVEVTPAGEATAYANGYSSRRRIVLPAQGVDQTAVDNPVVLIAEQADWLRTRANGGKVVSAEGFDLRFERIDGEKFDHEIESYDPLTGKLLAWVRLPRWTLAEQLQLFLYYGNAEIETSEANPSGVWQDYLARWRLPSGSDASPNARDLTPQGVASGTLLGSAGLFDGSGRLTLAAASWLDGRSSLTIQALVEPNPLMVGGSVPVLARAANAPGAAGISLGYLAQTDKGAANVVYAAIGTGNGEAAAFSRAGRHSAKRQLLHARWQSGSAPQLYLDGLGLALSDSKAAAGQTAVSPAPLELGRDWVGLIDEVRITDRVLPPAWIAVEALNMLQPKLSYGIGREEVADSLDTPVVAVPFNARTEIGKRIDIDVLSRVFAPGDIEFVAIVDISQPAHGTVTAVDGIVRYTPANDHVGKDQFTYTIGDGKTQSTGLIAVETFNPLNQEQDDANLPQGENRLVNSRLSGSGEAAAEGWTVSFPGEGAVAFAASWDAHRKVRCVSTGAARPAIEQEIAVEAGKRYVFSADCAAVADATDAGRVVLNHVPFTAGTLLTPRPVIGDLVPGRRVQYAFQATQTRSIRLRLGFEMQQGAGGGDVTFERPMLDQADHVRKYVATDPAVPSEEAGALDWNFVPYNGWYEGQIRLLSTQQNSMRIQEGYYGWAYTVRRTGTISVMQHQIASNHAGGETSKSTYGGQQNHPRPAQGVAFPLGMRVFNATANWQITGNSLRDVTWTYTNKNGGQGEEDGHARVIFEHSLNLPVTEGQRLLFLVYNRHANPTDNCPSVNMAANQEIRPSFGQNPPIAVTRFYGDDPTFIRASSRSGTLSRSGDRLFNFGIRYSDGAEDGSVAIDSNSNFSASVGGSNRVRQRFSSPYWRKTSKMALAILRDGTPAAGVTVRISGPDISAMQFTIPANMIGRRNVNEHCHQLYDLPGELILSRNTVYTVELSSPGSSGSAYTIHGQRHNRNMMANASVSTGSFVSNGPIDPHKWSGLAELSKNGGGAWQYLGYGDAAAPSADWPIAFYLGRKVAMTPEELASGPSAA